MKAKDFIIDKLNYLYTIFNGITLKYKYDVISNTHIVFVDPEIYYLENKQFISEKSQIVSLFIDSFMDESILFITKGSLIELENPDYQLESQQFAVLIEENKQSKISNTNIIFGCVTCEQEHEFFGMNDYAIAA